MPTDDFWFLAGLGIAFTGWGLMRWLLAKTDEIEWRTSRENQAARRVD